MPIFTRRWDDPPRSSEGLRILITRYRPRGLAKSAETWDLWLPNLGPSKELHAAAYGKIGTGISWQTYLARYQIEMKHQSEAIRELADKVKAGQTITLLCSSQCDRESRCHRSILKQLIGQDLEEQSN
jgi:uncharacterized protein YeaO (DUF488 family)